MEWIPFSSFRSPTPRVKCSMMLRARFFEFRTINAVVDHFLTTQKSALIKLFKLKNESGVAERIAVGAVAPASFRENSEQIPIPATGRPQCAQAIAIIGISGRYPQADTIERYWENLKTGCDSITEIPGTVGPLMAFITPIHGRQSRGDNPTASGAVF